MRKVILFIVISLLSLLFIQAQNHSVKGTVFDENNDPFPGVTIVVKGTTQGTVTDIDGKYSLNISSPEGTLNFSFIGFVEQEVKVAGKSIVDVFMQPSIIGLDELVVVGYDVQRKSVVTGAISSLSREQLLKAKPANPVNALGGRVSGVTLMPSSGQPGSVPKLVIRGIGTNGNSDPLYVVDGLPMGDMNSINPNDIESMEVLKDGTSTAIYGARGANGVVLITTRKGEKGKTNITYDGYMGWSSAQSSMKMLNSSQYMKLIPEFYTNDGDDVPPWYNQLDPNVNTNWVDAILDTAPVTEHNVTAMMGSDKGSSVLSLGYLDQNGIMGGDKSYFRRYSVRMNNFYDINSYLKVGANINYNYIDQNGVAGGTNGWNPMQYAIVMDPTTPIRPSNPEDGDTFGYAVTPVPFGRMWNPFSFLEVQGNGSNYTKRFYGNAFAEITLMKDLVFKTDIGVDLHGNETRSFSPMYIHATNNSNKTSVSQGTSNSTFWQWENTLRYKKSFNGHNGSVLLGSTASEANSVWFNAGRDNYPDGTFEKDNYWYLNAGDVATMSNNGGASPSHKLYSLFGRFSYNYNEKYLAEFVVRRDGSSNFGPENQYAVFPAVSLGWNISREDFWNVENFDSFKLRASLGQNGNEAITPFSYTSIIANDNYYTLGRGQTILPGSAPQSLVNPDVKWETSQQFNIGADMMFFGGKVQASLDYYEKTTKDLLMRPIIEAVRGNISAYKNVGEIKNSGFEMQAMYQDKIGQVNFSASVNASYLKNEVTKMTTDDTFIEGGNWRTTTNITRMEVGQPIGYFYLYKTNGIFQNQQDIENYKSSEGTVIQPNAKPGDFKWQDTNDDGIIDSDDRVNCGSPWPKWTMGTTLSANWRGIDFSIFLSSKLNYKLYTAQLRNEGYGRANLPDYYLDRWTHEGMDKGVPRLTMDDRNENFIKASDFYLFNASFLKIGNIELGYTLPEKWTSFAKIQNARLYLSMDNVATFTDYPYLDPEVGSMDNLLDTGLDYGMYPQSRTSRIGISVTF